jgi:peptide/nickel transport system substrate-binding protein
MIDAKPNRRQALQAFAALGFAAIVEPCVSLAADKKLLRVRSYSDLQILDPVDRLSAPEDDISSCCLNNLIRRKPGEAWEWELDAAAAIEQIDDTHIKFSLRPGLTWSNGFGEITAEDVKYSFERIADPKMKSPYADDWSALDHVEVTGPLSGIIILKGYFAPLWSTTLPEGSGKIVCKKAVEALPEKRFKTTIPAVSGPYLIKEWVPKQKTVLAPNPGWQGAAPYFDEIEIRPIEDVKIAEIGFEAGDLDYTWISLASLAKYKSKPPARARLVERPSLAYVWLGQNTEHPNLRDVRVRKAIQHVIDVDAILDAAYFGQAKRATGLIAPGLIGHRAKNLVERDVAAAKRLLADAGKAGGFATTISCLNTTERLSAAQIIEANLAEIGITAQIDARDSGTYWSLGDETKGEAYKNIQLLIGRFSMQPDPSWATVWFTPQQIGVWNWERWNNPEFGELHKQGLAERDAMKRDAIYRRMQDLMEESGAYLFLTNEATPLIHRADIAAAILPDGRPLPARFAGA